LRRKAEQEYGEEVDDGDEEKQEVELILLPVWDMNEA